jgi:hypothetical protein
VPDFADLGQHRDHSGPALGRKDLRAVLAVVRGDERHRADLVEGVHPRLTGFDLN